MHRLALLLLFLPGLGCDLGITLPYGCDADYPSLNETPFVLPYAVGEAYETGLVNCTSSFHAEGRLDEFAYDFDMPVGTEIVAARAGVVYVVEEDEPSRGSTTRADNPILSLVGNYVVVDHEDGTYAMYLHSPQDGISVERGQRVRRGDVLGVSGQSGFAGYPHLHFLVLEGDPELYQGIPVTFANPSPRDRILRSDRVYTAQPY